MRDIAPLAERQHGVISRAQLDLPRHVVRHLVGSERLIPMSRDVFRLPGAPQTWHQRVHAAVLAAPSSLASHTTATALHRFPDSQRQRGRVHVTQLRGLNHDRALAVVHEAPWLPERFARTVDGIPVVAPAVTLFQLSGLRPAGYVSRCIDDALVRRIVTTRELEEVAWLLCRRGRRGSKAFRSLVEERGVGYVATESELEARFLALVREAGLPEPEKQVNIGGEEWIGRVDFYFRLAKLIVELDGRRHQTALLQARDDQRRDIEVVRSGRRVIRLHWDEITGDRSWVKQVLWDLVGTSAA